VTVFCFVKFTVTCVVTPCSLVAAYQIPPPPPPEQPDYTASGDSNLLRHCNRFTLYFTQSTYHKWHVIRDVPRSGWFSCSALYVNSGATFFESRTGHQISWRFFFLRSLFGPSRSRDILSIGPRIPRSGSFRIYHSPAILPSTLYNQKYRQRRKLIYKILSSYAECNRRNVPTSEERSLG